MDNYSNNNENLNGKIFEKGRRKHRIGYYITLAILLVILYFAYDYYQKNNFGEFIRSETNLYTSHFSRDKEVKYSKRNSYRIDSNVNNDAMFYKKVQVKKNQPYKVTCMVKTENVKAEKENSGIGAQIAIEGTTERSIAISGTSDWRKIELIFNAKDREEVHIGFRLGGYLGNATGTAWFSDFTIEEGTPENNNEWNFACFIFENTDVTVDGKQIKLEVTKNDLKDIKNTISLFEDCCNTLSNGKMTAKCDIYEINEPLTKLSYDDEFANYVAAEDVEEQIRNTIENNNYDHIFVVVKLRR